MSLCEMYKLSIVEIIIYNVLFRRRPVIGQMWALPLTNRGH